MSFESRIRRLEAAGEGDEWDLRPLDIIGRVEAVVRRHIQADGDPEWDPRVESPTTQARVSEAVRACVEVMETQGRRAARRWACQLECDLLGYDPTRVLIRDLESEVERAAFARGDLTWPRKYPA